MFTFTHSQIKHENLTTYTLRSSDLPRTYLMRSIQRSVLFLKATECINIVHILEFIILHNGSGFRAYNFLSPLRSSNLPRTYLMRSIQRSVLFVKATECINIVHILEFIILHNGSGFRAYNFLSPCFKWAQRNSG